MTKAQLNQGNRTIKWALSAFAQLPIKTRAPGTRNPRESGESGRGCKPWPHTHPSPPPEGEGSLFADVAVLDQPVAFEVLVGVDVAVGVNPDGVGSLTVFNFDGTAPAGEDVAVHVENGHETVKFRDE